MEKSKHGKRGDIKREAGDLDDKSTDRPMLDEEHSEDADKSPKDKHLKRSPLGKKVSQRFK